MHATRKTAMPRKTPPDTRMIILPSMPRLREWAYAGFIVNPARRHRFNADGWRAGGARPVCPDVAVRFLHFGPSMSEPHQVTPQPPAARDPGPRAQSKPEQGLGPGARAKWSGGGRGRPRRHHLVDPVPLEQIEGALEQQSATLREVLSMLKSLMELEELARRVVGGDREAVHGLVRGSLPTLGGRCMARPRREAERADAIRRSAAVKVSLRQSRSV